MVGVGVVEGESCKGLLGEVEAVCGIMGRCHTIAGSGRVGMSASNPPKNRCDNQV